LVGGRVLRPLVRLDGRLSRTMRQTIGYVAILTLFNCTWVWGYVLVRGPGKLPEPAGEGTPFLKPGDPVPQSHNPSGEGHADAGHGESDGHAAPAKANDGHGGHAATAKKQDDGHGGESKARKTAGRTKKAKSEKKKEASAEHH
jgi:hypothetical protein